MIHNYKVPERILKEMDSVHVNNINVEKVVLVYELEKIEEIEIEID
jgi:hypothetical protein